MISETVRIVGDGPLVLNECPQVRVPLGESGADLVMRVVDIGAASSPTVPVAVHYVIVEATVESESMVPLFYMGKLPGVPERTVRLALSLLEAVRAGLFPKDRVQVVPS